MGSHDRDSKEALQDLDISRDTGLAFQLRLQIAEGEKTDMNIHKPSQHILVGTHNANKCPLKTPTFNPSSGRLMTPGAFSPPKNSPTRDPG